jgi:hypothetical protein
MKNKFFSLLSLVLVFSLIAPISGSIHDANASSVIGDELPNNGYSISGKVTDSSGNGIAGVTISAADNTQRSDYIISEDGYQFKNGSGHTSWEIFRDTFGAENVERNDSERRISANIYYHTKY